MSRVLALVEGQTEQAFISEVLAPWLGLRGVYLSARLIGKPGHKGGIRAWQRIRREIVDLLTEDPARWCTTMFDYYGFPTDCPGVAEARRKHFREAIPEIEEAILDDVAATIGEAFIPGRFLPYVQLHEFEALLFSDTEQLAAVLQRNELKERFDDVLTKCKDPEAIDDKPESAPSKRILSVAKNFDKVVHGPLAAKRIGLERMRAACPHFAEWVQRLESLGTPAHAEGPTTRRPE